MEPLAIIAAMSRECAFSILKRIVVDGTGLGATCADSGHAFQYPQTDRGRWNDTNRRVLRECGNAFQYPQTDRGRWN